MSALKTEIGIFQFKSVSCRQLDTSQSKKKPILSIEYGRKFCDAKIEIHPLFSCLHTHVGADVFGVRRRTDQVVPVRRRVVQHSHQHSGAQNGTSRLQATATCT